MENGIKCESNRGDVCMSTDPELIASIDLNQANAHGCHGKGRLRFV